MSLAPTHSTPRFTPQQEAAIFARGVSVGLSAGAGCGKTFVLTQRFLAELEPGPNAADLSSVAAITFTDKAAREMRERIRRECERRAMTCDAEHVDHWSALLRALDGARVSTIHAFCSGVLRSNAVEAGLDPQFLLAEPDAAYTLVRDAVREFVHARLVEGDDDLEQLVLRYGLDRLQSLLHTLYERRFQADDAASALSSDDWADRWRQCWNERYVPAAVERFLQSSYVTQLRRLLQAARNATGKAAERAQLLQRLLDQLLDAARPRDMFDQIVETAKVVGTKAPDWGDADYESVKTTFEQVRKQGGKLAENLQFDSTTVAEAIDVGSRFARLAPGVAELIERRKRSLALLDFDDLLLKTRDLLRDSADVRHRIARSIRLLMVDEFQDTDPVQADIVRLICGNRLTSGKLFLVGDHKQSIYRFRRADPNVFAALRNELPASGRLPLNVNFRSQPGVLDFVNALFGPAMGERYEPLEPASAPLAPGPSIEFLWAIPPLDESSGSGKVSVSALRHVEADWIARRIRALLDDPAPRIRDKSAGGAATLRRVRAGDVAILLRALSNVQEYEAALRRYDVDHYVVGGRAFFAQQEVFDLVNLCRWLEDDSDEAALIGALRSPLFNWSDDLIQIQKRNSASELWNAAADATLAPDDAERVRFAHRVLSELRSLKDRVSIEAVLRHAIDSTGYDMALLNENLGERKVANLDKLLQLAQAVDVQAEGSFGEYARRLQDSIRDEVDSELAATLPETGDVVRLMSIHQSKGLEFPVVIVADMNRKGNSQARSIACHPDLGVVVELPEAIGETKAKHPGQLMSLAEEFDADSQETLRLFYVATTRAADLLMLSAGLSAVDSHQSPWMAVLANRFDLGTGLLKQDPYLGTAADIDPSRIPNVRVWRSPPDVAKRTQGPSRRIPLADLPTAVTQAEPMEISSVYAPAASLNSGVVEVSVSRLEAIAQQNGWLPRGHAGSHSDVDSSEGDFDRRTEFGQMMHRLLERMTDLLDDDELSAMIDRCLTRQRPAVDATVRAEAFEILRRWQHSPLARRVAEADQARKEVRFSLRWPRVNDAGGPAPAVAITGAVDCLFQSSSGDWHVLDYKTGVAAGASNPAWVGPYELQLYLYGCAMEQWTGRWPATLGVVFFRPALRLIAPAWTEEQRARLQQLTNAAMQAAIGTIEANDGSRSSQVAT